MSDLVGNPEDRFSHVAAQMILWTLIRNIVYMSLYTYCLGQGKRTGSKCFQNKNLLSILNKYLTTFAYLLAFL